MVHRVPLLVVPIFGDQFDNARRVEDLGYGLAIWDKEGVTTQEILHKLHILKNDEE